MDSDNTKAKLLREVYDLVRKGVGFDSIKSELLKVSGGNTPLEEKIRRSISRVGFDSIRKVALKCSPEQFIAAFTHGDFPALSLTNRQMEAIKGGGVPFLFSALASIGKIQAGVFGGEDGASCKLAMIAEDNVVPEDLKDFVAEESKDNGDDTSSADKIAGQADPIE